MECRLGGMLHEIGPPGFRIDWGRITSWEPPSGLSFLWQIGADRVPVPNPEQASVVDVAFTGNEAGTEVTVVHREWDRHGPSAAEYRSDFEYAWPMAAERFLQHLNPAAS